jgi:formate hydrogenlyase subunit 4
VALLLAPLLGGWINQWRAWLQNKSAPGLLAALPYPAQALQQGISARRECFANVPRCAVHRLRLHGTGQRDHSDAVDRSAAVTSWPTQLPWWACSPVARVFISLAAMDVGTAFGTLGARREMLIGFLAEPALLMVLLLGIADFEVDVADDHRRDAGASRSDDLSRVSPFAGVAFTMVSLAENARVPVDNPATHLELTMIHEALILEYSGRHLALLEWGASLKLFAYSCIGLALFLPWGVAEAASAPGPAAGAAGVDS